MAKQDLAPDERECGCMGMGCEQCYGTGVRPATWYELGCPCCACERPGAEERHSLGIYAGRYCDACWRESGYRKEGRSGFSPLDAGEAYEEDDY